VTYTNIYKYTQFKCVAHKYTVHTVSVISLKYCMFLDEHLCWSWNNIPINKFKGLVYSLSTKLTTRVRCFYQCY